MAITVVEMDRELDRGVNPRAAIYFHIIADAGEGDAEILDAMAGECQPFFDIYGVGTLRLPRNRLSVRSTKDGRNWFGEVHYQLAGGGAATEVDSEEDEYEFSFQTSEGNQTIKRAKELRNRAPVGIDLPAPETILIGVTDDEVEGVEIGVSLFSWTETHVKPMSALTDAYTQILEDLTWTMNDDVFRGRKKGEVLLKSVRGRRARGESNCALTFEFLRRKNQITIDGVEEFDRVALTIEGTEENPAAYGHDYVWVRHSPFKDPDTKTLVQYPRFLYVDRVYNFSDYGLLGIGE